MPELTPAAQTFLAHDDLTWVVDDLRQRIMTGDLVDLEEAVELLVESASDEDHELDDEVAEELVTHLWRECHQTAHAWADQITDVDRVIAVLEALAESDVKVGLYTDWADLELTDQDPGGVLVWVNEWENLSWTASSDLRISYQGREATDAELAAGLIEGLDAAGLTPSAPADGHVSVPVVWRWHVEDPDDLA